MFLKFAKANKGKIDLLLFTSWDRFSRNIAEAYEMIGILKKLGIQPYAIEQPLDMTVSGEQSYACVLSCFT
ncbi:MAG: recombinase family protein [Bacteroidetes bacterium]|nr:recombinase family protein [Bacteroidota bacterium]